MAAHKENGQNSPSATLTSTIHLLECGHTIRAMQKDASGPLSIACMANCSHIARSIIASQTSPFTEAERTSGSLFICIPCNRFLLAAFMHPTWLHLEARLLASEPTAAIWTSIARLTTITEWDEWKSTVREGMARLKYRAGLLQARGGVLGAALDRDWQGGVAKWLEELFEKSIDFGEDAKVEGLMRDIDWMSVQDNGEGAERSDALNMFKAKR